MIDRKDGGVEGLMPGRFEGTLSLNDPYTLFRAIRLARKRWADSAKLHGPRKVRLRLWERYRFITAPPLWIPRRSRFYFDSNGSPVSKTGIAIAELRRAGVPRDLIYAPAWPVMGKRLRKLVRFAVRLPCAMFLVWWQCNRFRKLSDFEISVVLGWLAYRRLLIRYPDVCPVIISDVSPHMAMLASAAVVTGQRAIWWQDDYHHIQSIPFPVRAAVVLNKAGVQSVRCRSPEATLYQREASRCVAVRTVPDSPTVGVAVNGLFQARPEELATLDRLRTLLGVETLHLRLHPTSGLTQAHLAQPWITLAPGGELLDDYVRRMDVVIVGNSAVQLRILAAGVPVIHVDGLDHLGFDGYGYVAQGIVFGVDPVRSGVLELMKAFYGQGDYFPRLTALVGMADSDAVKPLQHWRMMFALATSFHE